MNEISFWLCAHECWASLHNYANHELFSIWVNCFSFCVRISYSDKLIFEKFGRIFSRYLFLTERMIPRKTVQASKSNGADKRPKAKAQVKQSNSHRIKSETPRPPCSGIQWNDVKSGLRHFKIKRWNSIGSWVFHCGFIALATWHSWIVNWINCEPQFACFFLIHRAPIRVAER